MMSRFLSAAALVFLVGCAGKPQLPVSFNKDALSTSGRMAVVMTKLPKVDTTLPGADCLLCIAVASAVNSALIDHSRTLSPEDLPLLKNQVADALRQKGADVRVIAEDLDVSALSSRTGESVNLARKDFSPLQAKYNVDKLVVIDIQRLGFERNYSAYIPVSDPRATLRGTGYIVDLKSNTYEWYMPVQILRSSDRVWDEPPKYPGLTNAYYQALEAGKDSFVKTLKD
jgi:hypothetical protein